MANKNISALPPFTRTLLRHITHPDIPFDTPGHHGGQFYQLTKEGKIFTEILGSPMFLSDISDSDEELGDPSAHEGAAGIAEQSAAAVWHADRTWFVLHGTSVSNRICADALLSPGDLVLFDRNNHKSLYQGALLRNDTRAVYLNTQRLPGGIIGGIDTDVLTRKRLRAEAGKIDPTKKNKKHPFRVACIESTTYDGFIADATYFIQLLSPICDYILFDSAWGGYEAFLPLLTSYDPLQAPTDDTTCGILVTQSVHKQLCGFSQTSQIHKKDAHIKNKKYYLPDDVLDNAFLMNISTSPYFPLFAALEMNAYIHQKYGKSLWKQSITQAIELRKKILHSCENIRPFLPRRINGKPWETYSTEEIAKNPLFWNYKNKLHEIGIATKNTHYLIDPCKILLTTNEGAKKIPAAVLSLYLQNKHIIPEKCGLHSILFLAEPGNTKEKGDKLLNALAEFENNAWNKPVKEIFPTLSKTYNGTVKDLCSAIETLINTHKGETLETNLFTILPTPSSINGKKATDAFTKGERKSLPLAQLENHVALECAMIYPPGICAIAAGEIWTTTAVKYFQFIETYINQFPDFAPHCVGLHIKEEQGQKKLYGYVWTKRK